MVTFFCLKIIAQFYPVGSIISLISGGVAGALLLNFIWRPALNEKRFIYFLGLVAGAAASFFILTAGNYFFSSQKTENKILVIEKTGNQFKRKRHCRTPYAVVNFDGERKKLKFSCEYEQTIGQYKKIDLTLSKGFFNYYVILERRLIQ